MSSDLLAEFDSFYRAPKKVTTNDNSALPISQTTSAFEDLSFLEASNPIQSNQKYLQPRWNVPVSEPSDDFVGDLEVIGGGNSQHTTAAPATDPRKSSQLLGSSSSAGQKTIMSTKAGFDGEYKAETRSLEPHIVRRPTIDIFSSNIANLAGSTPRQQQNELDQNHASTRIISKYTQTKVPFNNNDIVLFDAAEELNEDVDDDDFGDFETVSSPNPQIDLLRFESSPAKAEKGIKRPDELLMTDKSLATSPLPYPQAPKSPSFRERNPFADLAVTTPPVSNTKKVDALKTDSPVTAWPEFEPKIQTAGSYHDSPLPNEPEDWGDFADLPLQKNDTMSPKSGVKADAWAWDSVDSQTVPVRSPSAEIPPPTNIPPPSVLLSAFPQLFDLPQSRLFQPVASQPFAFKNRVLSDPSTIEFLGAYILLATVAARIIAGRKLRWKRDSHLSQAMKIGPAMPHGKSGMKLTGVDKAESTREEREVADLVRIWHEQVGRLRSAVATANSCLHDQSAHLRVPEISETMYVKAEGALTAPKACVICGLRREERIPKVDFQVEDSFGEWWVEHWGHRTCRNFWQEHEGKLKQR